MRLKKDDVRNKIIKGATLEFFEHGYSEANIRSIALKANITPGNIYRYYASKEELLEAIVADFNEGITTITKLENAIPLNVMSSSKTIVNFFINTALDFAIKRKFEAIILLSKSQGSKYEKVIDNLYEITAQSIDKTRDESNIDFSRVLARCVIDTEVKIISEYFDDEEKIKSLSKEFLFTVFASYNGKKKQKK